MRALIGTVAIAFVVCGCASAPKTPPASSGISIKEETPEYDFTFEAAPAVMEVPGLEATLNNEAAEAKAALVKENAEFRSGAKNDPREIKLASEAKWSRAADSGSLASVRLDYYAYGGGAHPITDLDGRIFEKATGKRLYLPDLLNKPVAQSSVPNALCKAIAAAKIARGMPVNDAGDPITCTGPEPSVDLKTAFVFAASTEKGKAAALRFLFGPYAIGAYVEGPYVIDVPLAAFQADLKQEYAAGFGGTVSPDDPPEEVEEQPYVDGGRK